MEELRGAVDGMGVSICAEETSATGALGSEGGVVDIVVGASGVVFVMPVVESWEESDGKSVGGG